MEGDSPHPVDDGNGVAASPNTSASILEMDYFSEESRGGVLALRFFIISEYVCFTERTPLRSLAKKSSLGHHFNGILLIKDG